MTTAAKHVIPVSCPYCDEVQLGFVFAFSRTERQACTKCGSGFKTEIKTLRAGRRKARS